MSLPARVRFPALNTLVDFFAMHRDFSRGIDVDPNLSAMRKAQPASERTTSERHDDLLADSQGLAHHHGDQIALASAVPLTHGADGHVGFVSDDDVGWHGKRDREVRAQFGQDCQAHGVADADAFADSACQNQHGVINQQADGYGCGGAMVPRAR